MSTSRKVRAVFRLALVSGMFWGVAALLGRVGYDLLNGRFLLLGGAIPWLLTRFFLPGAVLGFVGGMIYAGFLALVPSADEARALSWKRAALFGAIGGAAVFLAVRVTLLSGVSGGLLPDVIPTLVFGILGAGTGLAIHGTAKRVSLPAGDEPPKRVAP